MGGIGESMRRRATWALVGLISGVGLAAPAVAEEEVGPRFGRGRQHVGLQLGYGEGFSLGFTGEGDTQDVQYLGVFPRWGIGITDPFAEDSWARGNLDLLVEGSFLANFDPSGGHFAGGQLLLRYNWLRWERIVPYIEVGAGMGHLDFDLRDQDDGFNFVLAGGLGLQYFVSERVSLDAAWRYHHISNAGSRSPNDGINASVPSFGFTLHLD